MLNKEQKEAVRINDSPLLIIAGAGTGKTLVIVEKIKYLIKKKLAQPEEILALTFTEKAANEMEERVDQALPYGYFQFWISTFHSFADQILREEGIHIGLNPNYQLMSESESLLFFKKNLFSFKLKYFRPLTNPNKFLIALVQYFNRLQDENISPADYFNWLKKEKQKKIINKDEKIDLEKNIELAKAYQLYLSLKIKEGLMDFSDLIFFLNQLFIKRPNILKKYQQQFKYVLIDEFQDTNLSQYQLIKLLCPPRNNPFLTVVGDDSQSIYKFRGASISNIINFMKDYPNAKKITLIKNYRSNQSILDAAYQLIQYNNPDTLEASLGISKKLQSQKPDLKKAVNFFLADRVEQEADFIVNQINQLKKNYSFSDIAILVRANNHAQPFINAFNRNNIPYQFLGPGLLFKQPEIKDLIAYLCFLNNLDDSISLYRIINMDLFSIDKKDIQLLTTFSKKITQSLFQAITLILARLKKIPEEKEFEQFYPYIPLIKKETKDKLFSIYSLIKKSLDKISHYSAGQILYLFLEKSGYLNQLSQPKTEKEEEKLLNISRFFDKLKAFESTHNDASVSATVEWLEMNLELGESPTVAETDVSLKKNAINILTVHSAKGLEFPVVFLVNLTQGRFPTYQRRETIPIPEPLIKEILPKGNYHQQEERRLFYVGLTRAIDKVFLTASKFYYEGKREKKISLFVIEALGKDHFKKLKDEEKAKKLQLSIFDFKPIKDITKKKPTKIIKNLINNISFSQLQVFQTCPLQYRYQHILKLPTEPTAVESFGVSLHKTLEVFYKYYLKNNQVGLSNLIDIYHQQWLPIGYSSSRHQTRMKKEGEIMLTNYFKKFHNSNIKIISLEKNFRFKINNRLFLSGKIDRVDEIDDNKIELIDYKSGKIPQEQEIKKSFQLAIYALAASDKNLFNKKLSQIVLSFIFLQNSQKVSFQINQEELNKVKEQIINLVDEIETGSFPAQPGRWCDFCPFRMVCEAW